MLVNVTFVLADVVMVPLDPTANLAVQVLVTPAEEEEEDEAATDDEERLLELREEEEDAAGPEHTPSVSPCD